MNARIAHGKITHRDAAPGIKVFWLLAGRAPPFLQNKKGLP
jgi:hypothetical protein